MLATFVMQSEPPAAAMLEVVDNHHRDRRANRGKLWTIAQLTRGHAAQSKCYFQSNRAACELPRTKTPAFYGARCSDNTRVLCGCVLSHRNARWLSGRLRAGDLCAL